MTPRTLLTLPAVAVLAVGGIATVAHAGGDHTEVICHPNAGNGYVRISVDKHSSHFDDAGNPKHEHDGRVDVYSVNGLCPGDEPDPTEDPTPTDDPEPTEDPSPTDDPTVLEPTTQPSTGPTTDVDAPPLTDPPTFMTDRKWTCHWLITTGLVDYHDGAGWQQLSVSRKRIDGGCDEGADLSPAEAGSFVPGTFNAPEEGA